MRLIPLTITLAALAGPGLAGLAGCTFDASGLQAEDVGSSDFLPGEAGDFAAGELGGDGPGVEGGIDMVLDTGGPDGPDQGPALDTGTDGDAGDAGPCVDIALKYAGGQFVDVWTSAHDLTDNFTVSAWIKPSELKKNDEYQLVSRHNHTLKSGYVLLVKQQLPEFRVYHGILGGECACKGSAATVTKVGVWYHLAGSFTGGYARIFLDGKLIKTCTCKPKVESHSGQLRIGACSSCVTGIFPFKGLIDDVVVAKVARKVSFDPKKITDLVPCSQVVSRWPFSEGKGQTVASQCAGTTAQLGLTTINEFSDPAWIKGTCLADR
jgi:hypothetical protein